MDTAGAPSRVFPGEHQSQCPSVKSIKTSQQKQLCRASFRLLPRGYGAHYKTQRKSILRLHKMCYGIREESKVRKGGLGRNKHGKIKG